MDLEQRPCVPTSHKLALGVHEQLRSALAGVWQVRHLDAMSPARLRFRQQAEHALPALHWRCSFKRALSLAERWTAV